MYGHEPRIRELERRFSLFDNDLRTLRRQTTAVREGVRDYWIDGIGVVGTSNPCLTILQVAIDDCQSTTVIHNALVNASLHVVGHQSGHDYGTYSTTSGAFNFGLYLDPSDTSLDFDTAGSDAARYAATVQTRGITPCTTNAFTSGGSLLSFPATGYICNGNPGTCAEPIKSTLDVIDSRKGSTAATWLSFRWTSTIGVSPIYAVQPGIGPTAPKFQLTYAVSGGTARTLNPTSLTCPSVGVKFSATYTVTVTADGWTAGDTITFREP